MVIMCFDAIPGVAPIEMVVLVFARVQLMTVSISVSIHVSHGTGAVLFRCHVHVLSAVSGLVSRHFVGRHLVVLRGWLGTMRRSMV